MYQSYENSLFQCCCKNVKSCCHSHLVDVAEGDRREEYFGQWCRCRLDARQDCRFQILQGRLKGHFKGNFIFPVANLINILQW